ncbi:MAG: chemotaxis protein CheA, partial [Bacteroidetes bacterium]
MKEFKDKFIDEAKEFIQDLEIALLALEKNPSDRDIVEKIFRIMHSLKGEGSMFGFEAISEFTHNLENIYDLIRNNKLEVNTEILNVTFESIDIISNLLSENQDDGDLTTINNKIQKIISGVSKTESFHNEQTEPSESNIDNKIKKTYYISFKPNKDILRTGTNPLFLLDDISLLGVSKIFPHFDNIPDINNINPSDCYIYWDIFVATDQGINSIIDIFMFVDDMAKIEIHPISDTNLFNDKSFVGIINETIKSQKTVNIEQLTDLANELETIYKEKKNKSINDTVTKKVADNKISSIRVSASKLDTLINRVSELITIQAHLSLFTQQNKNEELADISEEIEKISRALRDDIFRIRLIPLETSLTRFYRLVRELSHSLKKNIVLKTEGTDTELDKNILEGLTEPLMHIIRNSIDHGIED